MTGMTASDSTAKEPPRAGPETVKLVCFRLHGQEYAVDIADVKETMALRPITRVFLTPPWLAGIINLRGDIVAVLDLACLCGLSPTDINGESRIVIVQRDTRVAGIVVDELAELRTLELADVQPPPVTIAGEAAAILTGVVTLESGAAVRVIDMQSLFESERLRAFQRGGS